MANSTSANLKLTVQATGENSGTWGQITNTNLLILEQAIGGFTTFNLTNANRSLTFTNGALSDGKNDVIKLTGTLAANRTVSIPDSIEKVYHVQNACDHAGNTLTFKTSSGTGVLLFVMINATVNRKLNLFNDFDSRASFECAFRIQPIQHSQLLFRKI